MKAIALALAAAGAAAGMHPVLGARLSGMGEHGIVNLESTMAKQRLCWTFEVPTKGITGASIRDAHGMVVARLGKTWSAKGCAQEPAKALRLIETKPSAYRVWVDTKGHPGELRGTLVAGMVHM
jgi:hypothetical protein